MTEWMVDLATSKAVMDEMKAPAAASSQTAKKTTNGGRIVTSPTTGKSTISAIVSKSTGAGSVSTTAPDATAIQTSARAKPCTKLRDGCGGSITALGVRMIRAFDTGRSVLARRRKVSGGKMLESRGLPGFGTRQPTRKLRPLNRRYRC
jgi:hypothetical protein